MEPATLPQPGVPSQSQYNIFLVIGVMLFLPPVGVYLLEGGCDLHVGINIVCWFFFITPAYIHGFGLLAYRKLYPKIKPHIDELVENLVADIEKAVPASVPLMTNLTGVAIPPPADVAKVGV